MTKVFTLLEFVAELPAIERDFHAAGPKIIERAAQMIQKRAKANIGKDHEAWPPLAPSTIADKQKHGFPTPKPLLRTGALRDSIEYTVHGNEGWVGSDLDIAVYQELGTSRIPPRSFLVSAAIASEDEIPTGWQRPPQSLRCPGTAATPIACGRCCIYSTAPAMR